MDYEWLASSYYELLSVPYLLELGVRTFEVKHSF